MAGMTGVVSKKGAMACAAHHVIRQYGPCTTGMLELHLGVGAGRQRHRLHSVLERRQDLFQWRLGLWGVVAGAGRPEHFKFPDWAEQVVQHALLDQVLMTEEEIRDELWDEMDEWFSRSEVRSHLAHFDDYRLEYGRWRLENPSSARRFLRPRGQQQLDRTSRQMPVVAHRRAASHRGAVVMTRRGSCYHFDEDCVGIRGGWAKTYDAGLRPTGLVSTTLDEARRLGRRACGVCAS